MTVEQGRQPLISEAMRELLLESHVGELKKKYEQWHTNQGGQMSLFAEELHRLSAADRERCFVLNELDRRCQKHKLGVSLKTCGRLATPALLDG